jgi:hypothetical protein
MSWRILMTHPLCSNYGCDYQLDLDGQVTCILCGAKDDVREAGYNTGKWSEDDDMGITPFLGPNR